MAVFRMKSMIGLTCALLVVLAGAAPLYAVCGSPISIGPAQVAAPAFGSCGINAIGQYWAHQNGVWNRVGTSGTTGNDSGALNAPGTGAILTCTDCPSPGTTYRFITDWGNAGADNCVVGVLADHSRVGTCDFSGVACTQATFATDCLDPSDTNCTTSGNVCSVGVGDLGPTDFVIAGQALDSLSLPTQSRVAFASIDLNEGKQQYDTGQLGAPAGDGNPCIGGQDSNAIGFSCLGGTNAGTPCTTASQCLGGGTCTGGVNCGLVPGPQFVSQVGSTQTWNLPAQTTVPYADDCNTAASRDVNCHGPCVGGTRPGGVCTVDLDCGGGTCLNNRRNLNAGRVLMVRRGLCTALPTNEVAFFGTAGAVFTRTELWHAAIVNTCAGGTCPLPATKGLPIPCAVSADCASCGGTCPTAVNTDANYDGFTDPGTVTPNPIALQNSSTHTTVVTVAAGTGRCISPATGEYHGICVTANAKQNNPCDGALAPSNNLLCGACVGGTAVGANCVNNTPCVGGGTCSLGQCSGCTLDSQCANSTASPAQNLCAGCLYFGVAAAADQFPNPTGGGTLPTTGATPWIAPYVSMYRAATNIASACTGGTCPTTIPRPCGAPSDCTSCGGTCSPVAAPVPASDRVLDLIATKSGGKVQVSWNTSAEVNTSGFRIFGERKQGDRFQVSSGLITAEGGTDGLAHHYTVELNGGDLKGASKLYVVVVHPSGPDETFGPANL